MKNTDNTEQPTPTALASASGSEASKFQDYSGLLEAMHKSELGAKAYNTVQLEGWLIQAINRHGFKEGLSVHQVLGAMEVVKQEVLDKWKESKAAKPQNAKVSHD